MIYDVRHVTRYRYASQVSSSKLALRLTPRDAGGQRCIDHMLRLDPVPRMVTTERDFFGNVVAIAMIDTAFDELTVDAKSRVAVARPPPPPPGAGGDWRIVAQAALDDMSVGPYAPAHWLFRSPRVTFAPQVTRYAAESFTNGRTIVDAARELSTRIHADFRYRPESTEISTPLTEAFAQRQGVCQDFAHIMIAGLRGLGIPAGYVSGYIRTITAPGQVRLEGADASHAWVSVWCGPEVGWFGVDPTNAMDAGDDHIEVAVGRDFSDVSPIHGTFFGSGETELEVGVDVVPVNI